MRCPKCHHDNPSDSRFCEDCGLQISPVADVSATPSSTLKAPIEKLARGTTFASRYEIIDELGAGGMGEVYRVFDNKIGEEVTLKLIRPEIAADKKSIERFRNELKFARRIAHKNVCRMYDLNQEAGTLYLTMEFVPGKNLKSMIAMTKQLSLRTILNIAKQICEGLAEAHRLGVVHRDLKPSNIMIDKDGNTRIMDFGLARSLDTEGMTEADMILGTPGYMSPEQVEGKDTDQRSDIYSMGVILYEMVTGRPPFEGDSALSIALKHKTEIAPDPRKFNPQIPEDLCSVIKKSMEKDRGRRYQNTEEIIAALNKIEDSLTTTLRAIPPKRAQTLKERMITHRKLWTIIGFLFAVAIAITVGILFFGGKTPTPPSETPMLVVLPFGNLGPPEDEYFADGLADEITTRLSALYGLGIISRTSAKQYKNTDKTIKQIGKELDVDYVLEGSVRWDRTPEGMGRVRITPQLIRVSDDTHLWSKPYDRVIEDIFSVQSEIAEQVTKQLDVVVLEPERHALSAHPTDNLEAYDYYLKGIEHEYRGWVNSEKKEYEQAIKLFEKATELDPNFAQAYVWQSSIHSWLYLNGWDRTDERLERSKAAVDKALELHPDMPEALLALAFYYYRGFFDFDRALDILESVQRARPNFQSNLVGYIQRRQGKWQESLENLEGAYKLNPRHPDLPNQIGLSYMRLRQYEEAESWFDRSLSIDPDYNPSKYAKVENCLLARGDTNEARVLLKDISNYRAADFMWMNLAFLDRDYQEALDRIESLSYDEPFIYLKHLTYASIYRAKKEWSSMKSQAEAAFTLLRKLVEESPDDPRFRGALGLAYAYLGQKDEAIREGNRAVNLYPISVDAAVGPSYIYTLTLIYTILGQNEEAIDQLEYLLSIPAGNLISVPILRLDPEWDSLREHQRFKWLVEENSETEEK